MENNIDRVQRAILGHIQDISPSARKKIKENSQILEESAAAIPALTQRIIAGLATYSAPVAARFVFGIISQMIEYLASVDEKKIYVNRLMTLLKQGSYTDVQKTQDRLNQQAGSIGRKPQQQTQQVQ